MIQTNNKPVIGTISQKKFCSSIRITNYEECSVEFLELLSKLAFVINTTQYYPDLVCVISNDNLDETVYELSRISSFCRIEQGI